MANGTQQHQQQPRKRFGAPDHGPGSAREISAMPSVAEKAAILAIFFVLVGFAFPDLAAWIATWGVCR